MSKEKAKELLKDKKVRAALATIALALAGMISPELRAAVLALLGALGA
jgi:hypothetical protein